MNFAIQRGMEAARSCVYYFKHNDTDDLERILKQYDLEYVKVKKEGARTTFIISWESMTFKIFQSWT